MDLAAAWASQVEAELSVHQSRSMIQAVKQRVFERPNMGYVCDRIGVSSDSSLALWAL